MRDYDDLIKRVQPYYSDLPSGGMMVLDDLVNAIRDLEVKCDNQHTQIVDLAEALKFARRRIAYYGAIGPRQHFDHDMAEIYPKIDAALSLSGEKSK